MTKILKRSTFIFACAVSFCMALLPSCGGGASKPAETEQSTAPKSYQNGDLMVGGKKGEMWFQTYSGEKAFNGATFHFARDFYRGYAPVIKMVDGKELHGVINLKGEEVIKIEHPEPIDAYDNGYFQIGSMDKQGYLDSTGKLVIPMNYGRSKGVYDGLFVLQKGLNWGVVNAKWAGRHAFHLHRCAWLRRQWPDDGGEEVQMWLHRPGGQGGHPLFL
jgi:hypothetical protein